MHGVRIATAADDAQEVVSRLTEALRAFNDRAVAPVVASPLVVFARDPADRIVGGAAGKTAWSWFHLEVMWVDEDWRGRGLGRELLQRAEDEARSRGCVAIWTDSFDFQAPGFYEALGYERFGILEDFPLGSRLNYLTKRL